MATLATHGTTGAGAADTTHIGVGAGALAGVDTHIIQDLFLHTIITTTIHLTMAVDMGTTIDQA